MTPEGRRASFSLASLIAIGCAIAALFVSPGWSILLGLVAIVAGMLGVIMAIMPGVRGGITSVLAILAGGLAILLSFVGVLWRLLTGA